MAWFLVGALSVLTTAMTLLVVAVIVHSKDKDAMYKDFLDRGDIAGLKTLLKVEVGDE